MKTCRLLVSVNAYAYPAKATIVTAVLCSGHRLEVSDETRDGFVRCLTERGNEVWIEENYVSHAQ